MAATQFATLSQCEVQKPCSVVIIHSVPLVRDWLVNRVAVEPGFRIVGQCSHASEALRFIEAHQPEIAFVDTSLADLSALQVVRHVRAERLPTKIILLGGDHHPRCVIDALRCGASGYLAKSSGTRELIAALESVSQGAVYIAPEVGLGGLARNDADPEDLLKKLTVRENEVLMLLVQGVRAKEIAARLELSPKTVDSHRSSLMRKLAIFDIAGLVKYAIRRELLPLH